MSIGFILLLFFRNTGAIADDFQKGLGLAQSGNYKAAAEIWAPLAERGNACAQYELGVMYAEGVGVMEDDSTALKWRNIAAYNGDKSSQAVKISLANEMTNRQIVDAQTLASRFVDSG
jgi:TPR repeat protein